MGRETVLFSSKETKPRSEAAAFLRAMAERLESGQVTLTQGDTKHSLSLPETLILELKIEDEEKTRKGTQHSLEIELKWFDDMSGTGSVTLE